MSIVYWITIPQLQEGNSVARKAAFNARLYGLCNSLGQVTMRRFIPEEKNIPVGVSISVDLTT
jgi:hypothetical protein